jgi:hypothetical protein
MTAHMWFTLVVALLAVISTACGGSHNPANPGQTVTGASPVPTRVVVGQILGFEINPMTYGVFVQTRPMPADGVLDAVVPYAPHPGAEVRAFLFATREEMTECYPNWPALENCPNALARATDGQMPLRLIFPGAVAGRFYFLSVRNRGPAVANNNGQIVEVGLTPRQ